MKELKLYDRVGTSSRFVLVDNPAVEFNHKIDRVNRNAGPGKKQIVFRNDFSLVVPEEVPVDCSDCVISLRDSCRVTFSGHDKNTLLRAWNDMKANVDAAFASTEAFSGFPLPLTGYSPQYTEVPAVTAK